MIMLLHIDLPGGGRWEQRIKLIEKTALKFIKPYPKNRANSHNIKTKKAKLLKFGIKFNKYHTIISSENPFK